MLKARWRQRSDSTQVLGAIRALTRLVCVGETLRQALNTLAATATMWLLEHSDPEWVDHYGKRLDEYRLPKSKVKREAYANKVGADGLSLLSAVYDPATPEWIREVAAQVGRHHAIASFYQSRSQVTIFAAQGTHARLHDDHLATTPYRHPFWRA